MDCNLFPASHRPDTKFKHILTEQIALIWVDCKN